MTSPRPARDARGRSEGLYRKLLFVYPRDFRLEFGDDMASPVLAAIFRNVGDPIHHQHRRGRQLRITRADLVVYEVSENCPRCNDIRDGNFQTRNTHIHTHTH